MKEFLTNAENGYADAVQFLGSNLPALIGLFVFIVAWIPLIVYMPLRYIFVPRRYWPG